MRLAECAFIALSTKDDDLIAQMIIGHSKIVTSTLADFVPRDKTWLDDWNPSFIHDIQHSHIIQTVPLSIKPTIDNQIFRKRPIMSTNQHRLMAIPRRRLSPVDRNYFTHTLDSLDTHLHFSIWFVLSLSNSWNIWIIRVPSNLNKLLFNVNFLLDDDQIICWHSLLLLGVVYLASEDEVHVIGHFYLALAIVVENIFLCC